jgi:coenzyme F420-reducing hydrogenase beta subunit
MPNQGNTEKTLLENLAELVSHNYCVGCGLCVAVCPDDSTEMAWNRYGALEPVQPDSTCMDCNLCIQVCPFSDGVIEGVTNPTEDELGEMLYAGPKTAKDSHVGYYQDIYAGYSNENRIDSTSGGMTTWILSKLLESGKVDKVICVVPTDSAEALFEYRICSTIEEVQSGARSRYYPVHLGEVLKEVIRQDAKYAIVGLPCVLKGVRLAQRQVPELQERIVFCVGIFCGGLKTTHFTEYLAAKIGVGKDEIENPQYRIKHPGESSRGYYFGCSDPANPGEIVELRVNRLRDLWGPGFFKPNVCDYCDDVVGEVADVSTGDAWISPYTSDWRGTNIVITRSDTAQSVIDDGLENNQVTLEKITPQQVKSSQFHTFEHRRTGLAYRLYLAEGKPVPRKRVQPQRPKNLIKRIIYRQRMQVRLLSQEAWLLQRETPGTRIFDRLIWYRRTSLRGWQYVDRKLRKIVKWITGK